MSAPSDDVVKVATWMPVSREMLDDAAPIQAFLDEAFDRFLSPWKYPDHYRWPDLDAFLFPRFSRLAAWWRSLRPIEDDR